MPTHHAITTTETKHGPPWGKRLRIPPGTRVVVEPAANQPPDGMIQWWMTGWSDRPLIEDEHAERLIGGQGIGFADSDLQIIQLFRCNWCEYTGYDTTSQPVNVCPECGRDDALMDLS